MNCLEFVILDASRAQMTINWVVQTTRRKCIYYVNTNFIVDIENGKEEAIEFARTHTGICTSTILLHEYRAKRRASIARRIAENYDIRIYRVPVLRLRVRAIRLLAEMGNKDPSDNTIYDTAHILAAKMLGAQYFITSDESACKRALRLGLRCIDHREGIEYAPS